MQIIKIKKWQLLIICLCSITVLCLSCAYLTLKIRTKMVYLSLDTAPYIHSKADLNPASYKEYVISEYKDKKVLALTFDDGPRKIYRRAVGDSKRI